MIDVNGDGTEDEVIEVFAKHLAEQIIKKSNVKTYCFPSKSYILFEGSYFIKDFLNNNKQDVSNH